MLDLTSTSLKIVGEAFTSKVEGVRNTLTASDPTRYRVILLTVEVTKLPDTPLTLQAPDFVLHYSFDGKTDVTPCKGVSYFSTMLGADRPMRLGYRVSSTTQTATTAADVVYVDLLFDGMEPNTESMHLLVAQPVGAQFTSQGYQP